ncbi:dihydrolipoyllysine-residue succinyltransferase component of 2-oxoglutarate dehydrogenase complex, mitochondrial-like isoform X2 [Paramacrobiotus metropolitanus]|uniref:dihydrolipoyllysine-residue succinyltransferase component of 2-oxoglutarate dehydrogenase complex, mitochondrial-like isoform X2 n=1 Tax=Paramacrobiotus metropolitanus TaxID=2943436 RepID=UPI002445ADAE|nr:dihydrolipoyllysine-residue succinyltransferase component of 2-oxoglutarate dehydrogenase complex, mitochondrial-like isoform X2 [Paramacrobiotus metropolitanus]
MLARNACNLASRKSVISGLSASPIRSYLQQVPARCLSVGRVGKANTTDRTSPLYRTHSSAGICVERRAVLRFFYRPLRTTAFLNDEIRTINTPPFADSISEGDVRWHKAVGDQIKEDDIVCEIETDKTAVPCPSQVSGVIEELLVKDGEKVTKGAALYKIRVGATSGKAADKLKDKAEPEKKEAKEEKKEKPSGEEKPKRAEGEKAKGGEGDAQSGPIPTKKPNVPAPPKEPLKSKPTSSVPVTPAASQSKAGAISGSRSEHREKMNRMRLRIAERLKEAQNTAAMLTTFNEVDMSNIIEMRNKYKDAFMKKHGVKLGFMSPFIKAAAYALQDQPVVNAVIDGTDILHRDYIDISVAVASPKGLVVPVIRNVEDMSYADIELTLEALSGKARDGTLAIEDMTGGTFTISNGGVFGSLFGTPIINPPQSAILGMHATNDRPVAVNGQVVIRPMMYVALTYDHRLIDGREAVTFLKKIKQVIEDPRLLLLDL